MNLKDYIGRILSVENIDEHSVRFFYHGSSYYPVYEILIKEGNNTWMNPSYSLMILVTGENRILEITRIKNYCLAKYDNEIENEAEQILQKITYGKGRPMWNYTMNGYDWEKLLRTMYLSETLILNKSIFNSKEFLLEKNKLIWRLPDNIDAAVIMEYDEKNLQLLSIKCTADIKIKSETHKRFCSDMWGQYRVRR